MEKCRLHCAPSLLLALALALGKAGGHQEWSVRWLQPSQLVDGTAQPAQAPRTLQTHRAQRLNHHARCLLPHFEACAGRKPLNCKRNALLCWTSMRDEIDLAWVWWHLWQAQEVAVPSAPPRARQAPRVDAAAEPVAAAEAAAGASLRAEPKMSLLLPAL